MFRKMKTIEYFCIFKSLLIFSDNSILLISYIPDPQRYICQHDIGNIGLVETTCIKCGHFFITRLAFSSEGQCFCLKIEDL
jgi:hypothetical protein